MKDELSYTSLLADDHDLSDADTINTPKSSLWWQGKKSSIWFGFRDFFNYSSSSSQLSSSYTSPTLNAPLPKQPSIHAHTIQARQERRATALSLWWAPRLPNSVPIPRSSASTPTSSALGRGIPIAASQVPSRASLSLRNFARANIRMFGPQVNTLMICTVSMRGRRSRLCWARRKGRRGCCWTRGVLISITQRIVRWGFRSFWRARMNWKESYMPQLGRWCFMIVCRLGVNSWRFSRMEYRGFIYWKAGPNHLTNALFH